jgi:hypothetical protein
MGISIISRPFMDPYLIPYLRGIINVGGAQKRPRNGGVRERVRSPHHPITPHEHYVASNVRRAPLRGYHNDVRSIKEHGDQYHGLGAP